VRFSGLAATREKLSQRLPTSLAGASQRSGGGGGTNLQDDQRSGCPLYGVGPPRCRCFSSLNGTLQAGDMRGSDIRWIDFLF
jgi:hypothetical protein